MWRSIPKRWPRAGRVATDRAPIEPGERALTGARAVGGGAVVATQQALYYRNGPESWSRLCWEMINDAGWNEQLRTLTITPVSPADPVRLRLIGRSQLPYFARERVLSSALVTTQVLLDDRIVAGLTARRAPGSDRITWVVILRNADDRADPAVRTSIATAIADVGAELGLVLPRPRRHQTDDALDRLQFALQREDRGEVVGVR